MKILFASHRFYPPDQNGGAQISVHCLLERLIAQGHDCEVIALCKAGPRRHASRALATLSAKRITGWADRANGYPVYRTASWHLVTSILGRIAAFQPDVILFDKMDTLRMYQQAATTRVPCVLSIVDVTFEHLDKRPAFDDTVTAFGNSRFTAQRVRDILGLETPVIYPIIDFPRYATTREQAGSVTMINPVVMKGGQVVLDVARLLPEQAFLIVEGWQDHARDRRHFHDQLASLPNVRFVPSTGDMRTIFKQTRILLAPSQCEEAFGRIALEAQVSGIPVLASAIGGLPEAVGQGGLLLDKDSPPRDWAESLQSMLGDDKQYAALSARAVENTRRREFDPATLVEQFLSLAKQHCGGSRK